MFFSTYLIFSLFWIVRGDEIENLSTEFVDQWTDLPGPSDLPDIWGSFPPYWSRTCSENTENNKFNGWNKTWFLSTMIELSIEEGGNDYGILIKGNCCIVKGVHGEGGFNVQRLVGSSSDSYRVYALCKPGQHLLQTIRDMNPTEQISKKAYVPIIQYYWSMKGPSAATFNGECELRTGCSNLDVSNSYFEAKTLFRLLDLDNVNDLSEGSEQGSQELLGCMKYIEDRKTYSCPVE